MIYGRHASGERRCVIVVRQRPGDRTRGILQLGARVFPCALGRGGISVLKREGDGATPLATMRVESGYLRDGAVSQPGTCLPLRRTRRSDGWCDAVSHASYNRAIRLPFPVSHERMWRDDSLYDVCIVLDWNRRPRRRGCGSAIFLHIARPGYLPTEGCVAVSPAAMRVLLPRLRRGTWLEVRC